jgi:hypothetical protein
VVVEQHALLDHDDDEEAAGDEDDEEQEEKESRFGFLVALVGRQQLIGLGSAWLPRHTNRLDAIVILPLPRFVNVEMVVVTCCVKLLAFAGWDLLFVVNSTGIDSYPKSEVESSNEGLSVYQTRRPAQVQFPILSVSPGSDEVDKTTATKRKKKRVDK